MYLLSISKTDRYCGAVTGVKFPSIICRAVASAVRLESWSTVRFISVHWTGCPEISDS